MKLLQINCVFAQGSTGKIVYAIHEFAKAHGDESYVIYGLGAKPSDPNTFRTTPWVVRKAQSFRSRITGYPYGGCLWGTAAALSYLKKVKPDIVHIQCMNGYMVNIYRILEYLKKNKIPTVITNHAEFMYTGGCTYTLDCEKWITGCHDCDKISKEHPISYFFDKTEQEWKLLQKAYDGFEKLTVCCVSDWVRDNVRKSPFFKEHDVITVFNGLDTGIFTFRSDSELRKKMNLEDQKVVVHVTPGFYNRLKGGSHVREMAKRFPDVQFLIIGNAGDSSRVEGNLHFIGRVDDQKLLAEYYSIADACILTSVRETFSMVTAESLCCGTPVVGFKAGGPEAIALPGYGLFVDQGDDDALEELLKAELGRNIDKKQLSEEGKNTYSDDVMCKNYYWVYEKLLN